MIIFTIKLVHDDEMLVNSLIMLQFTFWTHPKSLNEMKDKNNIKIIKGKCEMRVEKGEDIDEQDEDKDMS